MIKFEDIEILSAEVGAENPLPDIKDNLYIHASYKLTDKITEEESKYVGKGMISTMLPYLHQDGYTRDKKLKKHKAVVLENEYLKATFLPELGGRLWSLFDKKNGKDLLYVNPVFQPCNLALRNAWFSGGVEFNVSIKGHNPLTCSPLYAEKRVDKDGREFVSMYEWERKRGIVYSINAYLPENSEVLFIKDVIENTDDKEKYMYWWSNIAVPETPETRVIVPTDESFVSFYNEDHYVLDKTSIPNAFDTDTSYPVNLKRSLDFFYKLPPKNDKWIATADKDGNGLIQFSENILKARKLFLWGTAKGGRHWNEFLSVKNSAYIEIQAGLLNTQLEHFIMPSNERIEFVEAYAAMSGEKDKLHSKDFNQAIAEVNKKLYAYTDGKTPDKYLKTVFPDVDNSSVVERYTDGGGWGYVENLIRKAQGKKPISQIFNGFKSDEVTEKWVYLINNGYLENINPEDVPSGYAVGEYFINALKASAKEKGDFASYLYLGVALYENGLIDEANVAWEKSYQIMPNAWAIRNSASYYALEKGDYNKAKELIKKAYSHKKDNLSLAIACGKLLTAGGFYEEWLDIYDSLSDTLKTVGRIRLLKAKALIALNKLEEAKEIVNDKFEMADIKEGELSISALWFELYKKQIILERGIDEEQALKAVKEEYPLPYELDFRMHE